MISCPHALMLTRVVEADVMQDKNFGFVHVDANMGAIIILQTKLPQSSVLVHVSPILSFNMCPHISALLNMCL